MLVFEKLHKTQLGLLCAILSAAAFAVMTILVQKTSSHIPASEISCFRGLFTVIGLLYFVRPNLKILLDFSESRSIWFRSIGGAIAVLCYFWNATNGPAAEAKALANTNPLYVAFFSWLIFKETLNKKELLGLLILVSGAWVLVIGMDGERSSIAWIVGNIGAFFTAIAYLSLKRASGKFPALVIVFCFGLCVMLVSSLGPGHWVLPRGFDWIYLSCIGLTGLAGQIFLTHSYIHLKNTVASAMTLLTSLCLIFYDIFWTHKLSLGIDLVGNFLILTGMALMIFWKRKPTPSPGVLLQSPQKGL